LNFPVEIEITTPSNDLKAGMERPIRIKTAKQSMMVVPRNAFVGSVSSNQILWLKTESLN
jgi:hypothetical protein